MNGMTTFLGSDLLPSVQYTNGPIARSAAFVPPPPVDLEARALRAIALFLEDEYAFILGGNNNPKVDEQGDGAQLVNYKARELQMFVAQVVEKLTGKPMPAGTVRHPWQDELEAMGPQRSEDYPDLPPISEGARHEHHADVR